MLAACRSIVRVRFEANADGIDAFLCCHETVKTNIERALPGKRQTPSIKWTRTHFEASGTFSTVHKLNEYVRDFYCLAWQQSHILHNCNNNCINVNPTRKLQNHYKIQLKPFRASSTFEEACVLDMLLWHNNENGFHSPNLTAAIDLLYKAVYECVAEHPYRLASKHIQNRLRKQQHDTREKNKTWCSVKLPNL